MKIGTTPGKGLILAVAILFSMALNTRAAVDPRRTIRIMPSDLPLMVTNRVTPKVTTTVRNGTNTVKIPTNSTLFVRRGGAFVPAPSARREGTNRVYELKSTDVYVARGASSEERPLSTNAVRLPDAVRAEIGGRNIEGYIEVALQSELMVYNPATSEYEGTLEVCFRSLAPPDLAQKLLPLALRLHTTPGLRLATNALLLTTAGTAGCHDVPLECSSQRSGAKVTVKSDASGDQTFTVNFERAPFIERFKTTLIILAGICLGGLGGLVRIWQAPNAKQPWKRVFEGAFCGLLLVLLGQVGVQRLFHIEGPITTSVVLGLCGVLGYLGARMFERFSSQGDK